MKFHAYLTEAESNPVCRRLGIKDMIPTVMQRLTKYLPISTVAFRRTGYEFLRLINLLLLFLCRYPLLFESLCNCTAADSIEYKNLQVRILHKYYILKNENVILT